MKSIVDSITKKTIDYDIQKAITATLPDSQNNDGDESRPIMLNLDSNLKMCM